MKRDEAIKVWLLCGGSRTEAHLREKLPQREVDRIMAEAAEDEIDGLMALGILKVDAPAGTEVSPCPQEPERAK